MSIRSTNDIRFASRSDKSGLLPLIRAYYRFDSIKFDHGKIVQALDRLLRSRSLGRIWVIEVRKRELAGYAILTYNYDLEFGGIQGIITDLFITEAYRRQGFGARMISAIVSFCRTNGISAIELQVTRCNCRARKFYHSLGFETLDRLVMDLDLHQTKPR
jgi:GNAT superfamily N-acetyltransferase